MTLKNNIFPIFGLVAFVLSSCLKEEIAVPKHEQGDAVINTVGMEEDYRNQLFYDFGTNTIVSSNLKTIWDLAFESNGEHITLNTAKGMAVHSSDLTFDAITSEDDLEWDYDAHSGNLDSTGFGDWQLENKLYVIDAGYDFEGEHQGYFKIKIIEGDENGIRFNFGEITASTPTEITLTYSATEQFTYFSFITENVVTVAPTDEAYDIIFTQYTHLFTDPITPYLVTGVILNRGYTSAALYTDKAFEDITLDDAMNTPLGYSLDVIGYNWKGYSLDEGIYTTYPQMNYIIRTFDGIYYKLHFTSFYNLDGVRGFPTFEFQAL